MDKNKINKTLDYFLSSSGESQQLLKTSVHELLTHLTDFYQHQEKAYSGLSPEELREMLHTEFNWQEKEGMISLEKSLSSTWEKLSKHFLPHQLHVHHPLVINHLQCPVHHLSLLAEIILSLTNQSMDSWDQAPLATLIEEKVIDYLNKSFFSSSSSPSRRDGVFTSGGTQSNFMGVMLARDHFAHRSSLSLGDADTSPFTVKTIKKLGNPEESRRWRVYSSEVAHFSIKKSLHQLGLGEDLLVPIPVNAHFEMDMDALKKQIELDLHQGFIPWLLVGTAGTTNFGSIDPLLSMSEIAKQYHMWFHVDAAYGGGVLFHSQHRSLLQGIEQADSVTLDFHKMLYLSVSCSVFLIKDRTHWNYLKESSDYLNRDEDEEVGIPNLVNKSLQTTRRFDALKVFLFIETLGMKGWEQLIEQTYQAQREGLKLFLDHSDFEVINQEAPLPLITFRYLPLKTNEFHIKLRQDLFQSGKCSLGQTTFRQKVYLKLTLLNPLTTKNDLQQLMDIIINQSKHYVHTTL